MLDPLLCPHEEKKASSAALTWRGGRGALSAQSGAEVGGASEHAGHAPLPPPFRPAPHRALPCTVRRARPRARSAHTPEASGAAGGGGVPRRGGGSPPTHGVDRRRLLLHHLVRRLRQHLQLGARQQRLQPRRAIYGYQQVLRTAEQQRRRAHELSLASCPTSGATTSVLVISTR